VSVKRSPILGYNHNVQYRGLIFHIQTEDSGLKAPHVFTHLFHGGVIVSTRKLVYDAGTVEEGIKLLMQSQHKAVMKELRRGTFDAKIDEYLGDTPGLVPAASAVAGNAGNETPLPDELGLKNTDATEPTERLSRDTLVEEAPPAMPSVMPAAAAAAIKKPGSGPVAVPHIPAIPPLPGGPKSTLIGAAPAGESLRRKTDSVSPLPPAPQGRVSTEDLAGTLLTFGAMPTGELAAPRTITPARVMPRNSALRPAITPPEVHTRTATEDLADGSSEEIAEIHSPAMPSVEPPPGSNEHRSGEYAQHRRRPSSQAAPYADEPVRSQPNPGAVVSATVQGAAKKPTGQYSSQVPPVIKPGAAARKPTGPQVSQPPPGRVSTPITPPMAGRPGVIATPPAAATPPVAARPRTPTPARVVPATLATPRRRASTGAGVVMSKPAVVVGTPSRNSPVFQTQTRVRSAREVESPNQPRAISEKSLDEVILAYLSEDSKNET